MWPTVKAVTLQPGDVIMLDGVERTLTRVGCVAEVGLVFNDDSGKEHVVHVPMDTEIARKP